MLLFGLEEFLKFFLEGTSDNGNGKEARTVKVALFTLACLQLKSNRFERVVNCWIRQIQSSNKWRR